MPLFLLWAAPAFLSGIVLERFLHAPPDIWVIMTLTPTVAALILRRRITRLASLPVAGIAAVCLGLLLGALRYQQTVHIVTPADLAWYNDRRVVVLVMGTIVQAPEQNGAYTDLQVEVTQIIQGRKTVPVSGGLLARVPNDQVYSYGDQLRLRGRLQTPAPDPSAFDPGALARQGILSYMPSGQATLLPGDSGNTARGAINSYEGQAVELIGRLLPDPEASVLSSMLLGADQGLPDPAGQAFRDTGTAYSIAAEGFGISLLAGVMAGLFRRLIGTRLGLIPAVLSIALYTCLAGASAPALRAALLVTPALVAAAVGGRRAGLAALTSAAALTAIWDPRVLWDPGLQITFFAVLGLVLYLEPIGQLAGTLAARFSPRSDSRPLIQYALHYLLLTLAVQLTALPIMAYQLKKIPLVALIASPAIIPVQPVLMIVGGAALVLGLLFLPLGQFAAWAAWPLAAYMVRMVEFFDSLPPAVILLGNSAPAFVVVFFGLLLAATVGGAGLRQLFASSGRIANAAAAVLVVVLMIAALLSWRLVVNTSDGKLHVTFLDVGSAEAVLIQTPGGRHILIDGGPSTPALSAALGERISLLNPGLDWLIVASTNEDQVAALPGVLPRYAPANVLWSGDPQASPSAQQLNAWLAQRSVPVTAAQTGQTLDLGSGVTLKVVDVAALGATLLLEWNSFRALLPIGENFDTLDHLQDGKNVGAVTVLLLSQSGYAPLTPPDWIQNLNPGLIVLSVAAADPNGLPSPETLDVLGGRALLRTDRNGWIEVSTDGKRMWASSQK